MLEGLEEPLAGDHCAEACITGGHALGTRDDVGIDAEALHCEHIADATESADGFVSDHEYVVLVADLANTLEVPGGRREASAGVLHRLEEHRSNAVRTLEFNCLRNSIGCPTAEGLLIIAQIVGCAIEVRIRHLDATGHEGLEGNLRDGDTRDAQRTLRSAVVGHIATDDLVLGGLSGELEVLLGQFPGSLDSLTAAAGEEDAIEITRGVVRKALRELNGRAMRVRPDREIREFFHLLRGSGAEFLATMTDLNGEQAGEAIEVLAPLVIPDVAAVALDDDRHVATLVVHGVTREVHPEVIARLLCEGVVSGFGHVLRCRCHRVPQV